jgi:hypothetical protein
LKRPVSGFGRRKNGIPPIYDTFSRRRGQWNENQLHSVQMFCPERTTFKREISFIFPLCCISSSKNSKYIELFQTEARGTAIAFWFGAVFQKRIFNCPEGTPFLLTFFPGKLAFFP